MSILLKLFFANLQSYLFDLSIEIFFSSARNQHFQKVILLEAHLSLNIQESLFKIQDNYKILFLVFKLFLPIFISQFQIIFVSCTLMADKIAEPIQYIIKSELGGVLSKAFAELYRTKPSFPVTHLAHWLKNYSQTQHTKKKHVQSVNSNLQQYNKLQEKEKKLLLQKKESHSKQEAAKNEVEKQFIDKIDNTQHLEDLLRKWLPNYFQKTYNLSGAYVGQLTHPYKHVQPTNFEPGAELEAESPKIIEYIGCSDSQQKVMHMRILASETGISFDCFNQPEPEPEQAAQGEGEEKVVKQPKKTYIYVPDVTKNEKIHYFKFPKLGSYCCFPIKLKSVLIQSSFDQSVNQYKQYVKAKQEAEKQYAQKKNQMRKQYEQANKKYEQFEVPEEQPSPEQISEKKALQQEAQKLHSALQELQNNPPNTPQPKFNTIQRSYLLGVDTLGQDRTIQQQILDEIDKKLGIFKKSFQKKERDMLLHDILEFIEEQPKLDSMQIAFRDLQKNSSSQSQQQAKQKNLKEKQLQYEISITKAKKVDAIFDDANFEKSMKTYFKYNVAKFKQVLQIGLMLFGYKSGDINIPRTNVLNFRKLKERDFIEELLNKIQTFNLRPNSAQGCPQQYKITKLLQRLEKIDLEQLIKYNAFIWAFANQIKSYCWGLILCRDAKKQAYQNSIKNSQDRANEIIKYQEDRQKALDAAKAQLGQENIATFNQQEWITTYGAENPEPQPLQPIKLQQYLNID